MKEKKVYRILAIDDDESILRLIKNSLERSEFEVTTRREVGNIDICSFIGFDLILLDIMMSIDGLEICKSIREQIDVPIIFVTAKQLDSDLASGVKAGADDYIKKPFSITELVARVRMHIQREERTRKNNKEICTKNLIINVSNQEILIEEETISLTKREFTFLYTLASNPKRVYSVEELYERIYPSESDAQFRSIAEYIYQIRSKLKPFSINPIKTQWGGGYSWNEN